MSNSSLVTYINLSPNRNAPRNMPIDTVTYHHVAGNLTVETLGNVFKPTTRQASSTYGIGSDGRVGMYVEEKNRPWTTGSPANDHRAITIEIANISGSPEWKVSDAAIEAAINLTVDICKRNGIPKMLWRNDKSLIGQVDKQNVTIHEWFQNTTCPGPYLKSKIQYIVEETNRRLVVVAPPATVLKSEYDKVVADLNAARTTITKLNTTIEAHNKTITQLNNTIKANESSMATLITRERDLEAKITWLNKEISSLKILLAQEKENNVALSTGLRDRLDDLAEQAGEIQSLRELIEAADFENKRLTERIIDLEEALAEEPVPVTVIDWSNASPSELLVKAIRLWLGIEEKKDG